MSKPNYYGVYGKNMAGIFSSYEKLKKSGRYVDGIKLKGFLFKKDAIQFVVDGLSEVYKVMHANEINTELLARSTNWCYTLPELKKISVITITRPKEASFKENV